MMPMPLDHTVIGAATCALALQDHDCLTQWKPMLFVAALANLPDLDVAAGLLFQGDGQIFHRGLSHSLLFAVSMGMICSQSWRVWGEIPRLGFASCVLAIFSHITADAIFTNSPVSLFWPFGTYHSTSHANWGDIMNALLMDPYRNIALLFAMGLVAFLNWREKEAKVVSRYQP
jgi:membrane-bound metal-dependent hydrolase YbcI (DUF457 family)